MFIAMLALIGLLCAADQFTKYLTVSHFAPYVSQYLETGVSPYIPASEQVAAIPGLFRFTFRANTGGGFSILSGHTWLLILITAVFFVLAILAVKKNWLSTLGQKWSLAVICGGALGNLLDRVLRGYVVDMIELEFMHFPVFNVADCFITCGTLALLLFVFTEKQHDSEN
ncbi:MAG: signal peptidase II [Oscillospiraceae bacterium]|nr:signal peptidase II [Oscillospiraceae bacterium]MBR2896773.1 signal peptidase II [Oscillospiraceae bacterium]MBR2978180.1 signal peptidase II [Oscillospiraceae bacterium]